MGWGAFWNGRTTIYVNEQHRRVHYEQIAHDIVSLVPSGDMRVLDFGCGEALSADFVAHQCSKLVLCDEAEIVRLGLAQRHANCDRISVASPADVAGMPDESFDVIIVNSVIQYLGQAQLAPLLTQWRRLLAPAGMLVLGDLIPHDVTALTDASALLRFAHANGFLVTACTGLIKTFFSDYRRKRAELGLLRFNEPEILSLLRSCGFEADRHPQNMGHNPARMTITARVCKRRTAVEPAPDTLVHHQRARERARPFEEVDIALLGINQAG